MESGPNPDPNLADDADNRRGPNPKPKPEPEPKPEPNPNQARALPRCALAYIDLEANRFSAAEEAEVALGLLQRGGGTCGLQTFHGIRLATHAPAAGLPQALRDADNSAILAYLRLRPAEAAPTAEEVPNPNPNPNPNPSPNPNPWPPRRRSAANPNPHPNPNPNRDPNPNPNQVGSGGAGGTGGTGEDTYRVNRH